MKKKKRSSTAKALPPEQIERVETLVMALAEQCRQPSEFVLDTVMEEENGRWYLRVYLDSLESGKLVTLDDCQQFSQKLDPLLEEGVKELTDFPYSLEISSPGLFRTLRKGREFEFYKGRRIEILEKGKPPVFAILDQFVPETLELIYLVPQEETPHRLPVGGKAKISLAPEVKALEELFDEPKEEIAHD